MRKMRMSVRRLEALRSVAIRGLDDMEIEDDPDQYPEVRAELRAAQEAIWYLTEWLKEMNKSGGQR